MRVEELNDWRVDAPPVTRPTRRVPAWVMPLAQASLAGLDGLIAAGAFATAYLLREGRAPVGFGQLMLGTEFAPYAALLFFVVPLRLATLAYYGLYHLRGEISLLDDGIRLFKATAIGSLLLVAIAFLYRGGVQYRSFDYARGVFLLDFVFVFVATALLRAGMRGAQTAARRRQINLTPTLVVGRGAEAALCVKELRERPKLGYRVIGVVEHLAKPPAGDVSFEGLPVFGSLARLPEIILLTGANEVIVADERVSSDTLFEVLMSVGRRSRVEFRVAPNLFNLLPRKTEIDQLGRLPMISLFREPLSPTARIAKRGVDLAVAGAALGALGPLWLVIAALIKLDSRGPVFYKQERVGIDGRVFLFYKFRTMHPGADDREHREYQRKYIAGRPETNLGDDARPIYKLPRDERVTRFGKFLRRWSLDELPQIFNVLRGDMSVVGPRPPIPYEVEVYELWHRRRLGMKPGLTGLWQVSGRNRLSFDEMVRLDLFYIENWSLVLDCKIILRTIPVMLRGEAY
ncbi:MAG TPA: sugar transferase [Pyrinomonadaceae bacterium]|jgi:exopolysaccharide biosynthesis polyprenyl glycosylphosphotransferase|nr:sugar transferase [Pyrinomonadaceae bacterium]